MKYMIVDDEPIAHQIIEAMCADLPFMRLQRNCYDALEALAYLNGQAVDLIFLDIQMPKLEGFDFLRTLAQPPQIIVITAHREYALEGYELDVCDYLLKPFSLERFLRAVNKARARLAGETAPALAEPHETLFLKDGKKHHQVRFADIVYVEACGNYSVVHLEGSRITAAEKISELAKALPKSFLRVHKSYLVATAKIDLIEGDELHIGKQRVPIGRVYKPNILRLLGKG